MENRIMSVVRAIVCCHGRILLLKRYYNDIRKTGEWEFPGSSISFGETPENAIIRAIKEQAGLTVRIREIGYISTFQPKENEQYVAITYICTTNRDIAELSEEYSDYMWVRPEKLYVNICDNAKPEILQHYERIEDFISREYV